MQTYGVFYATSFLDLYRSPRQLSAASLALTVMVDSDEQYLFLVSLSLQNAAFGKAPASVFPTTSLWRLRPGPSHRALPGTPV